MRKLVVSAAAALVLLVALGRADSGPPGQDSPGEHGAVQSRVALRPELGGLNEPLFATHAGDGTGDLYVVEKAGAIRVASRGGVRPQPFLDISSRVGAGGQEQGLLGLAFHPDYPRNGFFYVNYTDRAGNTMIERYTARADRQTGDPASAKAILAIDQPFDNHNGGMLLFGPDRKLWIGTGDGGAGGDPFGNAQDRSVLLGKMLRIDVDGGDPYGIPSDNPYVGDPAARPEIWAIGLRNPWRYSFDRQTGDLYLGDVGQSGWEEIDFAPAGSPGGLNFGWNVMEGNHCYPPPQTDCNRAGLVPPIFEYPTGRQGCSVIGGYVYRGTAFPAMAGIYWLTDFCSGTVWGLERNLVGGSDPTHVLLRSAAFSGFSSFGEDEAGELYITALGTGIVYRLVAE